MAYRSEFSALAAKTGDAFLRDSHDGSIHFLDTVSGEIERIASDEQGFESVMALRENAQRWLMTDVVKGQAVLGMSPGPDQCLSFKIPPALGGQLDPGNFELSSILVHFSINGQIHQQIKDLPAGARIGEIKLEGQDGSRPPAVTLVPGNAKRKPWWKLW